MTLQSSPLEYSRFTACFATRDGNVPLELRPGSSVPIPCRQCQKCLIRFTIVEGVHLVSCPKCGGSTEVKVFTDPSGIRIKSAKAGPNKPQA